MFFVAVGLMKFKINILYCLPPQNTQGNYFVERWSNAFGEAENDDKKKGEAEKKATRLEPFSFH